MTRQYILPIALGLALVLGTTSSHAAVRFTRVTIAATATLIITAPPSSGQTVLVRNPSAVSVYLGDSTVTTANGFEVAAGDAVSITLGYNDTLYGIVAAATQVVHTLSGQPPQ